MVSARRVLVAGFLVATLTACSQGGNESTVSLTGKAPTKPAAPGVPLAPSTSGAVPIGPQVTSTIATGLRVPWGLTFLPNGDAIVTERDSGRVLQIVGDRHRVKVLGKLTGAVPSGEGGLLGVVASPRFSRDRLLYFYLTTATDNRIVRVRLAKGKLGPPQVLLDGIPRGDNHDGGRLTFGPDGDLYASTGETGQPELAQDPDSLGGKILRLKPNGDPAPGNPSGTAVFTSGHRNVQGLAFDKRGQLWASGFGTDKFDELNKIVAGKNYGWPEVEGKQRGKPDPTYTDPQQVWKTGDASPSGLAFTDGDLWMASLRGERLWRITVRGGKAVDPTAFFVGQYGRMRTVAVAPDGSLWLMTSNRDGRGDPSAKDDQILQVQP